MNRQRKVLITITYNEMGIIIDTKTEEVAQSNLQPTCNQLATNTISRQAAIDFLEGLIKTAKTDDAEMIAKELIAHITNMPSAEPHSINLNQGQSSDFISRQKAIEALTEYGNGRTVYIGVEEAVRRIEQLPSAEHETFEWCDTCKEYDQKKHCCHRFSKVIRQAFEEMKVVHCIDCRHSEYDEVYGDRYCHYNGKAEVVDDYHYCRDGERRDDE